MSEEFKNMDDSFRHMAEEMKVNYHASYWDTVKSQLDDDSLDSAFRAAATSGLIVPEFEPLSGNMDDIFMDEAFKSGAENATVNYSPEFFEQFAEQTEQIEMSDAFVSAASQTEVNYNPDFWMDADEALQAEGLHYEYQTAYWKEARKLLDRADRTTFFLKWSAVAAILLLISFGSGYQIQQQNTEILSGPVSDSNESWLSPETEKNGQSDVITQRSLKQIVLNTLALYPISQSGQESNLSLTVTENTIQGNTPDELSVSSEESLQPLTVMNLLTETVLVGEQRNPQPEDRAVVTTLTDEFGSLTERMEKPLIAGIANNPETMFGLETSNISFDKFMLTPVHSLSLVGAAGIGNRYGYTEFTPGLRTSFGIEYLNTSYRRRKHIEFGASFLINHVQQTGFGTEKRVNVYTKEGDVSRSWLKLQLREMLYANFNVLINYRLNDKNKLRFGFGVERLISVKSNMSYQLSGAEEITTVNNNWGVKEGVNRNDLRVSLGYEYQVTNRIALQLTGNYGLFDRTDNEFLSDELKDHELMVSFGVKYTIMRKM